MIGCRFFFGVPPAFRGNVLLSNDQPARRFLVASQHSSVSSITPCSLPLRPSTSLFIRLHTLISLSSSSMCFSATLSHVKLAVSHHKFSSSTCFHSHMHAKTARLISHRLSPAVRTNSTQRRTGLSRRHHTPIHLSTCPSAHPYIFSSPRWAKHLFIHPSQ